MSGPLDGLRPAVPPPELRGRVLAAAREAAESRKPGLLELLLADRALRVAAALVLVLFVAQLLVDRDPQPPISAPSPVPQDEASPPTETGFTAAEQIDDVEPSL